jgi:SAM-dependent methyltransferase
VLRHGTRAERFTYIYETQKWGTSEESRSGGGSALHATLTLREQLARLLAELEVTSIFDAGCGDFHWMKELVYSGSYVGADIVPGLVRRLNDEYGNHSRRFVVMDLSEDRPPAVDLIICREVLFHLPNADVVAALENFRKSGSKWLLVTTDTESRRNWDIEAGGHRALNLERPPFSLPKPRRYLIDAARSDGRRMSLYSLGDLRELARRV